SVGAIIASLLMIRLIDHIERRGQVLLWAIVVYGFATVLFGLSRNFMLTFACLALTGAADTVSMVIRNIVRQLTTPDAMRGRMTSGKMVLFMGGTPRGEREAGRAATAFGPVVSVVSGGIGCLVVTAWIASSTPQLRQYRASAHLTATEDVRDAT